MPDLDELQRYMNCEVVVDTRSPILYIGTLTNVTSSFLTLDNVDVHDINDTNATKEIYILNTKKYGIKKNRTQAIVKQSEVVSISRLEDVIEY